MNFLYNGKPVDGYGQPEAYGEHPPAQGVLLLGGLLMDADGIDNPRFDQYRNQLCDESINGLYFGDGMADNERLGLQEFNQCPGEIPGHFSSGEPYPGYAYEYYNILSGYWEENDLFYYGGNGTPETGGYGPACRFIFPGESDTLNWGTGCVPPNRPVNWTEETAGNNPADCRGMGSTGPVTFAPGDVLEIDVAFVWARDYDGTYPGNSVGKLRELTDQINLAFVLNLLPNGEPIYGVEDPATSDGQAIKLYPNPTSGMVTVVVPATPMPAGTRIEILNNQGTSLDQLVVDHPASSVTLNLSGYPSGFYFIAVTTPQTRLVAKVLVMD